MANLLKTAFLLLMVALPGAALAESGHGHELEAAAPAEPPPPQPQQGGASSPVQMMRTLQLMQDQIAVGSTEAHMGQRGLLMILDDRFMKLAPETWAEERNIRAAIAFVLSGGSPKILRKLLEMGDPSLSLENRAFVEGALAYVEGREEEAKEKLLPVDIQSLPPMLGAQLALVQSALLVRTDPKKSVDLLDFVRLQAPGTLLEEGALRRQVFVASQTGDTQKFLALTSGYLRRYRHSVYAGNFRQRLASALTKIDFGKDQALFEGVVEMLMDLEPEARRELYLLSARASIDQGLTKSARMLAEKAHELSSGDPGSATKAKLYRAAAMVVSPETIRAAVADLQSIDKFGLAASDANLLESALLMAKQIQQMPDAIIAARPAAPKADNAKETQPVAQEAKTQQAPEQPQAVLKAREALNRIDKLIKDQVSTVQ